MELRSLHLAVRTALAGLTLVGLTACAATQQPSAPESAVTQSDAPKTAEAGAQPVTPPPAPAVIQPEPRPAASGPVAEVQQLIQSRQVNELRTTYNGSYGASMLFKPDELVYYVALFRQKEFLRVSKTRVAAEAEQTYRRYAAQTSELAEVDIRRITLQAEQARTDKLLSERTSQLEGLQADVDRQRQQAAQIAANQKQAREEAAQLSAQQKDAAAELRRLQARIRELERQQANVGAQAEPRAKSGAKKLPPK
ncbi:putative lipoprotein [plant metagenome]|uniref:Putative lipoprotein n=2 Tax=root TaxID=1 RepID=A0A1C3K080_9BURK|nr:DUF2968 domain-containing protein [Orrella dioscoreae]SBT24910.1 putative lipoprotein [Orrella dioscoreae]SOE50703.1 putative lipoprotein [Orrella dioscoreae]